MKTCSPEYPNRGVGEWVNKGHLLWFLHDPPQVQGTAGSRLPSLGGGSAKRGGALRPSSSTPLPTRGQLPGSEGHCPRWGLSFTSWGFRVSPVPPLHRCFPLINILHPRLHPHIRLWRTLTVRWKKGKLIINGKESSLCSEPVYPLLIRKTPCGKVAGGKWGRGDRIRTSPLAPFPSSETSDLGEDPQDANNH